MLELMALAASLYQGISYLVSIHPAAYKYARSPSYALFHLLIALT